MKNHAIKVPIKVPALSGRALSVFLMIIFINGCSLFPTRHELPVAGEVDCSTELSRLDADIVRYTYFDPALHRIPGQPLLRSNRFIASFASPLLQGEALQNWLQQMNTLAVDAYLVEFSRLPMSVQNEWKMRNPVGLDVVLNRCSKAYLSAATKLGPSLIDKVQPPDNYSAAQRFWGIYPLTKRMATSSIEAYRSEMTSRVLSGSARQFDRQTVYLPATKQNPSAVQATSAVQPPLADTGQKNLLVTALEKHAPELWVEHKSNADEVGSPFWRNNDEISLNSEKPQAYTYISYTRFKNEILTQLNYVYWFSARPKNSRSDLYGGDLDAVVWRVTLNSQGKPVLYDSIHACGCYHLLFLPSGTQIDPDRIRDEKPLAFPLTLLATANSTDNSVPRLRLKIEAGTHYLIDVSEAPSASNNDDTQVYRYSLTPYQMLLSMAASPDRRSLFGPDGIVSQSSRLERFVLWPLGVPNAGAMRQAGTHAIAFVGKRHFDDAWLLDELGIRFE